MSKLLDNHISVFALTGTYVRCRLLTKIRIFDAHKNEKNGDAAELLNGENGEMVKMRRWIISTCNGQNKHTKSELYYGNDSGMTREWLGNGSETDANNQPPDTLLQGG